MHKISSSNSKKHLIDEIHNYLLRARRSKKFLTTSVKVSTKDLVAGINNLRKNPNSQDSLIFLRDIIGSSAWIGNSYLKYLATIAGFKKKVYGNIDDQDGLFIIDKVRQNIRIPSDEYSPQQVFNAIYRELDYAHHNPKYKTKLTIPQIFPTIVLISGVFNELYKTAAFERGVQHLSNVTGIRYFVAETHGFKSSSYNTNLIRDQLFEYSNQHPDEKLWILSYSKGGVDSLHFLLENAEWCEKNIAGLSTIAAPILGSQHADHRLINLINQLEKITDTKVYKYLNKNKDLLAKEFQSSLDHKSQKPWFRKNYHKLPCNPFYTALALESEWYESHIYMILAKLFFPSKSTNDGIVDAENAFFPDYFNALNLGIIKGHHLIGAQSSTYSQEALISAHIIFLKYLNYI